MENRWFSRVSPHIRGPEETNSAFGIQNAFDIRVQYVLEWSRQGQAAAL
jgi:hypothetical protein